MSRNTYLGTRVKDIGRPGLDTLTEVKGITAAVIKDVKDGKITYRTGMSRLNLLTLIVSRSKRFKGRRERRAQEIINHARIRLKKQRVHLTLRRVLT